MVSFIGWQTLEDFAYDGTVKSHRASEDFVFTTNNTGDLGMF